MADVDDNTDDNLQQNPGETNPMQDMTDDEKLPEDGDTPYSPPAGAQDRIDDTHQVTDSNVENDRYDEGIEGASGVDLPGQAADEGASEVPDTK